MRIATQGQIGEFNLQQEDWMSYSERLEEYFIANGIKSKGHPIECGWSIDLSTYTKLSSSREAKRKNF